MVFNFPIQLFQLRLGYMNVLSGCKNELSLIRQTQILSRFRLADEGDGPKLGNMCACISGFGRLDGLLVKLREKHVAAHV